jgi:hypothetical protein
MGELRTNAPTTLVSSSLSPAGSRNGAVTLRTCLVVSNSTPRAAQFAQAAVEEHWATIVCGDAEEAVRNAVRHRIQLALVDLESVPAARQPAFCRLIEHLARGCRADGTLLAVCGKPNDEKAEVWSRGLGVWMYLPGINSRSDIGLLYGQARRVVEKLEHGVPRPTQVTTGMNGTNGATRAARPRR